MNYTKASTLNLLIVESSSSIKLFYDIVLAEYFQNIYYAANSQEGIEIFENRSIDMLICNQVLSGISGTEMIKQLRETTPDLMVILSTSNDDSDTLIKALNLHISNFLLKPFTKDELSKVVLDVIEPSIIRRLLEEQTQEHLKSLKKYENYNKQEQEKAFIKQSNAIKNDFHHQYIQYEDRQIWYLNGLYKPYDILNGDGYSLRRISDSKVLFFIIDAMGKGVSASISSIISLTMVNIYIDTLLIEQKLNLKDFLEIFLKNIITALDEQEVLSILFAEIDLQDETMQVASYAMPPVLLMHTDKHVIKVPANNIPISKLYNTNNISSVDIKNIENMLFCTDGIFEAYLPDNSLYFQHIEKDFLHYNSQSSFMENFYNSIDKVDDDITICWMSRLKEETKCMHETVVQNNKKAISNALNDFNIYLEKEHLTPIDCSTLGLMANELLTNAYEHGNLGISQKDKIDLISHDNFEDRCLELEALYGNRVICFNYGIRKNNNQDYFFMKIKDEGEGFDSSLLKELIVSKDSAVAGRGFSIVKKIADEVYYSEKGNTVIVNKHIRKGKK